MIANPASAVVATSNRIAPTPVHLAASTPHARQQTSAATPETSRHARPTQSPEPSAANAKAASRLDHPSAATATHAHLAANSPHAPEAKADPIAAPAHPLVLDQTAHPSEGHVHLAKIAVATSPSRRVRRATSPPRATASSTRLAEIVRHVLSTPTAQHAASTPIARPVQLAPKAPAATQGNQRQLRSTYAGKSSSFGDKKKPYGKSSAGYAGKSSGGFAGKKSFGDRGGFSAKPGKPAGTFDKFKGNKKPFGNRPPARKWKPEESKPDRIIGVNSAVILPLLV